MFDRMAIGEETTAFRVLLPLILFTSVAKTITDYVPHPTLTHVPYFATKTFENSPDFMPESPRYSNKYLMELPTTLTGNL